MKLFIIDGYGFLFRAYHSLPPLSNPKGEPVGAIYGFANMLMKLLEDMQPEMIVVALDSGKKGFRSVLYPQYKAHRPEPPEDLKPQFATLRTLLEAFGIRSIEISGMEADDIIATLAKEASSQQLESIIISSDKDLLQLLQLHHIAFYDPMKSKYIGEEDIIEKYGVKPEQFIEFLAIVGDASDNVPGIKGAGVKTAAKLLQQYQTLDGIYNNLSDLTPKQQNMFAEAKQYAYLSKQLVTLKYDVELPYTIDDFSLHEYKTAKLQQYLMDMGFHSLLKRIGFSNNSTNLNLLVDKGIEYKLVHDLSFVDKHYLQFCKDGSIALHYVNEKFFISSATLAFVIPFVEHNELFAQNMHISEIWQQLAPLLSEDSIKKITLDAKSVYKQLLKLDIKVHNLDDINLMSYCINSGRFKHSASAVIQEYLGVQESGDVNSNHLLQVYSVLRQELVQANAYYLYYEIERKLPKVLAEMENVGVYIDVTELRLLTSQFSRECSELEQKIWHTAGKEFNIASPKQLGNILFEELQLPYTKKAGKIQSYSTGVEVLEKLVAEGYQIAEDVLQWRKYSKLINTYTEVLPKHIDAKSGRIHTNILLTATSTGRFASQEPNLQNIPVRSEEGGMIRAAFKARMGYQIVSADYSQIEIRLLAYMADVKSLQMALGDGGDVHALTASQVFGIPMSEVNKVLRRRAKTINFGIIYGLSAYGLAQRLDISIAEATNYIDKYFKQYPGIKQYMDDAIKYAKEHGYVKTIMNRRCYLNDINSKNYTLRSMAERAAINAPLQGSAADIIKAAMVQMPAEVRQYLILQVHDELLFEIPKEKIQEYVPIIQKVMEEVIFSTMLLKVDVSVGDNWGAVH